MTMIYSNYINIISKDLIHCLQFEGEDNKNILDIYAKTKKIAWNHFATKLEDYHCEKTSTFFYKIGIIPLGLIKSVFLIPFHLFVTPLASRSPDLSVGQWLKKSAYVIAQDVRELAGYSILLFNEKRALFLIDDAKFQKNCLINLYGPDKEKFITLLFRDLILEDLDCEIKNKSNYNTKLDQFIEIFKNKQSDFIKLIKNTPDKIFVTLKDRKIIQFMTANFTKIDDELYDDFITSIAEYRPVDHALRIAIEENKNGSEWIKEYLDEIFYSDLNNDVIFERANSLIDELLKSKKKEEYITQFRKLVLDNLDEYKKNTQSLNFSRILLFARLIMNTLKQSDMEQGQQQLSETDELLLKNAEKYKEDSKPALTILAKASWFQGVSTEKIFLSQDDAQKKITDLFDLPPNAPSKDIKKKYKKLIGTFHPDKVEFTDPIEKKEFFTKLHGQVFKIISQTYDAYKHQFNIA